MRRSASSERPVLKAAKAAKEAEERRAKGDAARTAGDSQRRFPRQGAHGCRSEMWLAAADAQVARAENELKMARFEAELSELEAELGGEKAVRLNRLGVSMHVIARGLDAERQSLPAGTRREILTGFVYLIDPNGVR